MIDLHNVSPFTPDANAPQKNLYPHLNTRTLLPFFIFKFLQRKLILEYCEATYYPIRNSMQGWIIVPDLGVLSNAHWQLSFCTESSNLQLHLIIVSTQHHCVLETSCDLCQNNVADCYQMWVMGKGQCPLFKPHYLLQKIYAAGPYIHKIPSRKSPRMILGAFLVGFFLQKDIGLIFTLQTSNLLRVLGTYTNHANVQCDTILNGGPNSNNWMLHTATPQKATMENDRVSQWRSSTTFLSLVRRQLSINILSCASHRSKC